MRTSLAVVVFAAAACCQAASPPNTLTPDEARAGWVLLFDGKTMDHWVDPRKYNPPGDAWTIEDGCLKANARPRFTEDLFSHDKYRDFELEFDWRISKAGNSGVKYRIQDHLWVPRVPGMKFEAQVEHAYQNRLTQRPDHGQDYVVGFEYQIADDSANRDALSNSKHSTGALYDMVSPSSAASKPVGEFNHSRIVLRGNHVEHWLNGVKVVDSTLDGAPELHGIETRWSVAPDVIKLLSEQPHKDCPFSLQNHDSDAWFRNIKIRRLSD
jgi:hypothetical protein